MTIAEVTRAIYSYERVEKRKAQERAALDYIAANLIGRSIASYFSQEVTMPELAEAYPSLFTDESEKVKTNKQKQKAQLSALRFKQFANSYNERFYKTGGANLSE